MTTPGMTWRDICRPREIKQTDREIPCLCCAGSGFIQTRLLKKWLIADSHPSKKDGYDISDYPWLCLAAGCTGQTVHVNVPDKGVQSLPRLGAEASKGVVGTIPPLDWQYIRQTTQSQYVAMTLNFLANNFTLPGLCDWLVTQEQYAMAYYRTSEGQALKQAEITETKKRLHILDENYQMPGTVPRDGAIDVDVITHALPPSTEEDLSW